MMDTKVTSAASYTAGAFTALFSWLGTLSLSDVATLVGITSVGGTFALNFWFQRRRDLREQREHDARMRKELDTRKADRRS